MRTLHFKYLGLLSLVGASVAAHAAIIDDFSTGAYSIVADAGNPNVEAVRAGTMMGLQRDALLQYGSGPLTVSAVVDSGAVQFFNADSQTQGTLTLQYDGLDGEIENGVLNNGNGLNANFSGDQAFAFDFRFVDAGIGPVMNVTTTVVASNGTFTVTSAVPNGTNIQLLQNFSAFGGANFSDVRRVDFTFSGPAATDFTLDGISTVSIPGPAAIAVFLVGLAPRFRRRKA